MKTIEELVKEGMKHKFEYQYSDEWLNDLVRIVRIECINECAERAMIGYNSTHKDNPWHVQKESILSLIEELKYERTKPI